MIWLAYVVKTIPAAIDLGNNRLIDGSVYKYAFPL